MAGQGPHPPEIVVAFTRLSRVDRDGICAAAQAQYRTLSAEIRRIIEAHLAENEQAAA